MKKHLIFAVAACMLMFWGCEPDSDFSLDSPGTSVQTAEKEGFIMITAQEAKKIIDEKTNYIILDVRTQEEYDRGHIENALLIPDYEIAARAESELPDKNQLILVYCRSGNRSKSAAAKLAAMGYTNVREFGGIMDWPYGTVK